MKLASLEAEQKKSHIIEQLNKLEYYQTDGLTYKELIARLELLRANKAREIEGSPWF